MGPLVRPLYTDRWRIEAELHGAERRLARGDDSWRTHQAAAVAAHLLDDLDRAWRHYTEALGVDPRSGASLTGLAWVYRLRGDLPTAERLLWRATSCAPGSYAAWEGLAGTLLELGRPGTAEAAYLRSASAMYGSIARRLRDDPLNAVVPHHETVGLHWFEGTLRMVAAIGERDGVDHVLLPTGDRGEEDPDESLRTAAAVSGGRYWVDRTDGAGVTRIFLPRFFDAVKAALALDSRYVAHLEDLADAVEAGGRAGEARLLRAEAREFADAEAWRPAIDRLPWALADALRPPVLDPLAIWS